MDKDPSIELTNAGLILFHLAQHPTATDHELASLAGLSLRQVRRLIADLIANGLLTRQDSGEGTHYTASLDAHGGYPHDSPPTPGTLPHLLALLKKPTTDKTLLLTGTGGVRHLFQYIWEQSAEVMALSDSNGIVLATNAHFFDLFGYTPEEIVGQDHAILYPPDQREWARELYQQVFTSTSIPEEFESTNLRKDGSLRTVRSRITFLTENYVRTAMLSIIRDSTSG